MLKKTITFKDLDDNLVTEDFYFNLSKAEVAEMELSREGGLSGFLEKIVEAGNGGEIITTFKSIIRSAVGKRSEDGRRFIKNDEVRDDFFQSDAYSELFMELCTDANAGAAFVRGIVPSDMAELAKLPKTEDVQLPEDDQPPWIREDRDPTKQELMRMSKEEMAQAFARRSDRAEKPSTTE